VSKLDAASAAEKQQARATRKRRLDEAEAKKWAMVDVAEKGYCADLEGIWGRYREDSKPINAKMMDAREATVKKISDARAAAADVLKGRIEEIRLAATVAKKVAVVAETQVSGEGLRPGGLRPEVAK